MRALALFASLILASAAACASEGSASSFGEISARADAARQANNLGEAVTLYSQALALNPKWGEGWWFLGSIYYDQNKFPDAIQALARVVELDPQNAPALGLLGLSEFEAGQYASSLSHVSHSLQIGLSGQDQMEGVLRYHQALLLAHAGDFDGALQKYAWFVLKGVQHDVFLTALGLAALHAPRFPEAVEPHEKELYLAAGKATFLSIAGLKTEAAGAFEQLVRQFGSAPYVHYLYGSYLLPVDRAAALPQFEEEVRQFPDNGASNAMLAWLLAERDEPEEAAPFAAKAAQEDPNLPLAQYVYGNSLGYQGKWDAAIEHLALAVALQPGNVLNHVALAAAYARARKPVEARQQRELAVKMAKEELAQSQK